LIDLFQHVSSVGHFVVYIPGSPGFAMKCGIATPLAIPVARKKTRSRQQAQRSFKTGLLARVVVLCCFVVSGVTGRDYPPAHFSESGGHVRRRSQVNCLSAQIRRDLPFLYVI
jgi:hypothetical protein